MLRTPFDRLTIERRKEGGIVRVRETPFTVSRVLELLATYADRKELVLVHPDLEEEDLEQVLEFAAAMVEAFEGTFTDAIPTEAHEVLMPASSCWS